MNVTSFALVLIFSIVSNVSGASISNVYLESEIIPTPHFQYGLPYTSLANSELAQINTLPYPGYVFPCVLPCIYQNPPPSGISSAEPTASAMAYNTPTSTAPVVVANPKEEVPGYEFAYLVYDEHTGDHKAQREVSDGSVVQGEYSFLQPDGYVREVKYVADDVSGFNAIVKSFLPVPMEDKKKMITKENLKSSPSCTDVQSSLINKDSKEITHKTDSNVLSEHNNKHQNTENAKSDDDADTHHNKGKHFTKDLGLQKEISNHVVAKPKNTKHIKVEESNKGSEEISVKNHNENNHSSKDTLINSEESSKENHNTKSKQPKHKSKKESSEEKGSEESKEIESNKKHEKSNKKGEKHNKESLETSEEKSEEESQEEVIHEDSNIKKTDKELLIPYKDLLRCIQKAANQKSNQSSGAHIEMPSPLTYLILNKPC